MDPVTIPDEQFNSDCLPPIETTDLLSYLVLETAGNEFLHQTAV